ASLGKEYLLGQPVYLRVEAKNVGREALQAYRPEAGGRAEPEGQIFLSEDGRAFQRWVMGYPVLRVEERPEVLKPGEAWAAELTVLYSDRRRGGEEDEEFFGRGEALAFERPGKFSLKVKYPWRPPGAARAELVESNVLEVRVKEPRGVDARVWQRLGDKEV